MPQGDGTGPGGMGPGTGRGRGWCRGFLFPQGRFSSRRMGFLGALVPLAGAVIRDAANPNGLLRSLSRKLLGYRETARNQKRDAVNATYTVVEEKEAEKD